MDFVIGFLILLIAAIIIPRLIFRRQRAAQTLTKASRVSSGSGTNSVVINLALPDVGESGGATDAQRRSVEKLLKQAMPEDLTFEQANMLLSAREYAHGVLDVLEREEIFFGLDAVTYAAVHIVNDPILRDYVISWSRRRYLRGSDRMSLRRNEHFDKVYTFLKSVG